MDPGIVVALMVAMLLMLLVVEVPVGVALALSGGMALTLIRNPDFAGAVSASAPVSAVASVSLTVLPMFILMGMFAVYGRMAQHLFAIAAYFTRRMPGGLAIGTVFATAGFGAVSGSSVAAAATMGRVSIDEMIARGYRPRFASGLVASAGTLGAMIPPSVILVLFSVLAGESIGMMLVAGIVPGALTAVAYAVYVGLAARRPGFMADQDSAAARQRIDRARADASRHGVQVEEITSVVALPWRGLVRALILFVIVIGGIYSGIFTATESGAVGAFFAAIMVIIELRKDGIRGIGSALANSLRENSATTTMIFFILVGSGIFSTALVVSRVPQELATWITELPVPPLAIVGIIFLLMIPMGMFLESISLLVIIVPLTYPIVTELGFEGVWFGILLVKAIEIGLVTPPVGISCFVVASTSRSVTVPDVFRGIWPFLVVDVVVVAILFAFPDLVMWLPNLMQG